MTDGKSLFTKLMHRNASVREAAREELRATVERHGGDERAAAAELRVSVRTVRKWIAPPRPAASAAAGVENPAADAAREPTAADPRDPPAVPRVPQRVAVSH